MNNKSLFVALLYLPLIVPSVLKAQTGEGSIFVRGAATFNFNNVKQKTDNTTRKLGSLTTIELNPAVGFFIVDGIAGGVAFDWQRETVKDTDNDKNVDNTFTLGPFGRFYTEMGPFFQAQFTFGGGFTKVIPDGGPEVKERFGIFSWGLGAGYPYFVNDNVSLEALLLYRSQNRRRDLPGGVEQVTKYRGLMLQLGFVYYIFDK